MLEKSESKLRSKALKRIRWPWWGDVKNKRQKQREDIFGGPGKKKIMRSERTNQRARRSLKRILRRKKLSSMSHATEKSRMRRFH